MEEPHKPLNTDLVTARKCEAEDKFQEAEKIYKEYYCNLLIEKAHSVQPNLVSCLKGLQRCHVALDKRDEWISFLQEKIGELPEKSSDPDILWIRGHLEQVLSSAFISKSKMDQWKLVLDHYIKGDTTEDLDKYWSEPRRKEIEKERRMWSGYAPFIENALYKVYDEYRKAKAFGPAKRFLEEQVAFLKKYDSPNPTWEPAMYSSISRCYISIGYPEDGIALCDHALTLREKTTLPLPDNYTGTVKSILNNKYDLLRCSKKNDTISSSLKDMIANGFEVSFFEFLRLKEYDLAKKSYKEWTGNGIHAKMERALESEILAFIDRRLGLSDISHLKEALERYEQTGADVGNLRDTGLWGRVHQIEKMVIRISKERVNDFISKSDNNDWRDIITELKTMYFDLSRPTNPREYFIFMALGICYLRINDRKMSLHYLLRAYNIYSVMKEEPDSAVWVEPEMQTISEYLLNEARLSEWQNEDSGYMTEPKKLIKLLFTEEEFKQMTGGKWNLYFDDDDPLGEPDEILMVIKL